MVHSCRRLVQSSSTLTLLVLLVLAATPRTQAAAIDPWGSYNRALDQRPLLTTSLTAATLMSISDVACQKFEISDKTTTTTTTTTQRFDQKRTLDVAITGFIWSAPIAHVWYTLLERVVPPFESKALGVLIRLVLESLIWSPLMVFGYLTCRSVLEGASPMERLRQKFTTALVASWKFWPPLSIINYALIPLPYRVLYINILSMLWNGYLTTLNAATTTCASTTEGKIRKE
mmetsp:Transcript_5564/g.9189  ORF Transcript_5564/g.9189 Transcript_5564/m.9189 type:complete len:231 (+) Transcript_5564:132-824(+)